MWPRALWVAGWLIAYALVGVVSAWAKSEPPFFRLVIERGLNIYTKCASMSFVDSSINKATINKNRLFSVDKISGDGGQGLGVVDVDQFLGRHAGTEGVNDFSPWIRCDEIALVVFNSGDIRKPSLAMNIGRNSKGLPSNIAGSYVRSGFSTYIFIQDIDTQSAPLFDGAGYFRPSWSKPRTLGPVQVFERLPKTNASKNGQQHRTEGHNIDAARPTLPKFVERIAGFTATGFAALLIFFAQRFDPFISIPIGVCAIWSLKYSGKWAGLLGDAGPTQGHCG